MAIVKAETVFRAEAGFTGDELQRIMAAGAGRTVQFAARERDGQDGREAILLGYARGESADELAARLGCSRRTVFNQLKEERDRGLGQPRLQEWRAKGLSWREVGRLYRVSHEAARKAGEP
jgi:hypothetical protein